MAQPLQAKVTPRYAYVVDPGVGQILEYSINPANGALVPIKGCTSTPDPNSPSAAIVDKTGSFLYVANKTANNIWVYSINPATGCLITSPPPAVVATRGTGPVAMDLAAHELYLFVSDSGSTQIDAFAITNGGTLTPVSGSPFTACANPAGIAVDEVGSYVFLASNVSSTGDGTGTGAVCQFTYGVAKTWLSAPASFVTAAFPTEVAIDPIGQFLYVANSGANTLESLFHWNRGCADHEQHCLYGHEAGRRRSESIRARGFRG